MIKTLILGQGAVRIATSTHGDINHTKRTHAQDASGPVVTRGRAQLGATAAPTLVEPGCVDSAATSGLPRIARAQSAGPHQTFADARKPS
jgi:hypothetical protein